MNSMEQENCPLDFRPSSNRAVEVHQPPLQVTAGQSSMGGKSIPLLFITCNWPACMCSCSGQRGKQDSACVLQDSSILMPNTSHLAVPALSNVETKSLDVKVSFVFPAIKGLTFWAQFTKTANSQRGCSPPVLL